MKTSVEYQGHQYKICGPLVQPRQTVWGLVYKVWVIDLLTGFSGYLIELTSKEEVFRIL